MPTRSVEGRVARNLSICWRAWFRSLQAMWLSSMSRTVLPVSAAGVAAGGIHGTIGKTALRRWGGSRRRRGLIRNLAEEAQLLLAPVVVDLDLFLLQILDGVALLVISHNAHIHQPRTDLERIAGGLERVEAGGLVGNAVGRN